MHQNPAGCICNSIILNDKPKENWNTIDKFPSLYTWEVQLSPYMWNKIENGIKWCNNSYNSGIYTRFEGGPDKCANFIWPWKKFVFKPLLNVHTSPVAYTIPCYVIDNTSSLTKSLSLFFRVTLTYDTG